MSRFISKTTVTENPARFFLLAVSVVSLLLAVPVIAAEGEGEMMTLARPGVRLVTESASQVTLSFQLPPLKQTEVWNSGERFDQFAFEDDPPAGPEGWPDLPSMVRYVLIPPQSGVELKLSNIRSHTLANINPYPHQPLALEGQPEKSQAMVAPGSGAPLIRDSRASEVDGFWPHDIARLERPAIIRGNRIVPIVINPVRYCPKTGELQIIDDFDVEVSFNTDANRVNLVERPDRVRPSVAVDKLLQQIAVNPSRDHPERDLGMRGGSVVYVIGEGGDWNQINEELVPLVEWRRQMGWPTEVMRIQDITSAASIKEELVVAYQEWECPPEFIVLVGDGNSNYTVGFFDARRNAQFICESDHEFGCLEGDDLWPEAAVGRLAIQSPAMLGGIVEKIVQYESDPYIGQGDQVGWQRRAALAASDFNSGLSTIDISRWSRRLILDNGYTDVAEFYCSPNNQQVNPTDFINQNFNAGISLFAYRGWANMNGFDYNSVNALQNRRMLPFIILATCNTNDFGQRLWDDYSYSDRFIHYTGGGAIGAVGSGGVTHTQYNNLLFTGILRSLLGEDLHQQGWAFENGKSHLISQYEGRGDVDHPENGGEGWLNSILIYNLMGDPATDVFTDVPRELTVTAPEDIRRGETHIEANILHADDATPANDAVVCLYKEDAFQLVVSPDLDGLVVFDVDPEWTQSGSITLTVTGHNLLTSITTYAVARADQFVGTGSFVIDDDNEGRSSGNGDGEVNQIETIELTLNVVTSGRNRPEGALDLHLTAVMPGLDVIQGDTRLDAAPEVDQATPVTFLARIDGRFPSGKTAAFNLEATVGENTWLSSVSFPVIGPKYEYAGMLWEGDPLRRGGEADLFVRIRNVGGADGPPLTATLLSFTGTVGAFAPNGSFGEIAVGNLGESEAVFGVSAHPLHFGGQPADMALALLSDAGFLDTVFFQIATSPAPADEPFGPDAYGYICFDNSDEGWFATPEYDWVELNPRLGNAVDDATNAELFDTGEQLDHTTVVDLPFEFVFYGDVFDQLTISTNGWMAVGDCHELLLARNRIIPGPENAPGMIAPFWDDLVTTGGNSGIFYWFDEDQHRFIVEWSQMRRLGPEGNGEASETFEAILYDPEFWPSFTGDGDIEFQYQDVTDGQSCFQNYDTPFASVGIAAPDISTGLGYTYWNRLTDGAAPLEEGRTIKFTTLVEFRQGVLQGSVRDAATNEPIAGARIAAKYGFATFTDERGLFTISSMLVDSTYFIRVIKQFYNDSTLTEIEIRENDTTYVEFGLLHPEFSPEAEQQEFIMLIDSTASRSFGIANNGNGSLWYKSRFVFAEEEAERDEPDEPFRIIRQWAISDSMQDTQIQSVVFAHDHWIVAGGASGDSTNYFYILDREGTLVDQIEQPIRNRLGLRDMEYYDGYIWATNLDTAIYKIDPENGDLIAHWKTPRGLSSSRCITFNPLNGHVFLASTTGDIYECNFDGDTLRVVAEYNNFDPRDIGTGIRKSGFGWFRDDPDGFPLYIIASNEVPQDLNQADIAIFKLNPETGEIRFVTRLQDVFPPEAGGKVGMTITTKWDSQVWVMAAIIEQARSDQLAIFELAPNTSWITYSPVADTLDAGAVVPIELSINSADLEIDVDYIATIEFTHNANPGQHLIPITLHVVDTLLAPPDTSQFTDEAKLPYTFEMKPNYPNPFNPVTTIRFSLDQFGPVKLTVYDVNGREVAHLLDRPMKPGSYDFSFDANALSAGLYVYRLEAGAKSATQKMVLMK